MGRERRAYIVVGIATALLCSAVGGVAATGPHAVTGQHAQADGDVPPAFVVALQDDGSADVTVTYTFDLTDDARQAAFEEIRTNETAERAFEDRFRQQLQTVASDAADATGREMSITGVDIAFETDGGTGVVRLTADWEGLAATDGDSLTVTEPFASGFEPDRTFAVVVPDGYAVEAVSPSPDGKADGRLTWSAGTDLDGFELTASPADGQADTPASDGSGDGNGDGNGDGDSSSGDSSGDSSSDGNEQTTGDSGPGFGVVAGVLAVLGVALLALRRR